MVKGAAPSEPRANAILPLMGRNQGAADAKPNQGCDADNQEALYRILEPFGNEEEDHSKRKCTAQFKVYLLDPFQLVGTFQTKPHRKVCPESSPSGEKHCDDPQAPYKEQHTGMHRRRTGDIAG